MAEEEGNILEEQPWDLGPSPMFLATRGQVRGCREGALQSAEAVRGAHGFSERHPQGRRLPGPPGPAPGPLAAAQGDHGRQGLGLDGLGCLRGAEGGGYSQGARVGTGNWEVGFGGGG